MMKILDGFINEINHYREIDEICYECGGYGDDYYINEYGEMVCRCSECTYNNGGEVE